MAIKGQYIDTSFTTDSNHEDYVEGAISSDYTHSAAYLNIPHFQVDPIPTGSSPTHYLLSANCVIFKTEEDRWNNGIPPTSEGIEFELSSSINTESINLEYIYTKLKTLDKFQDWIDC